MINLTRVGLGQDFYLSRIKPISLFSESMKFHRIEVLVI
jgi:hypothetical protein